MDLRISNCVGDGGAGEYSDAERAARSEVSSASRYRCREPKRAAGPKAGALYTVYGGASAALTID